MKKSLLIIFTILASTQLQAQFIKEKSIDVSIGIGVSAPYQGDFYGTGFYAQAEYVLSPAKWIDLRPYVGYISTRMSKADTEIVQAGYKSTANAVLVGGKARVTAPIPWFAPYAEMGLGTSIGSFETDSPYMSRKDSGMITHIPFSLGVELGPRQSVNVEFTYYFHNSLQQFSGAAAVGLSIPLGAGKSL